MPVVKSPRGGRSPYAPAKVSAAISAAYVVVHPGGRATHYRRQIQDHTRRVGERLRDTLGGGQKTEWPRSAILQAIHDELREEASPAVYETFAEDHPLPKLVEPSDWDRMEPMPEPGEVDERLDPVWTVLGVKAPLQVVEASAPGALAGLGVAVTRLKKTQPRRPRLPSVRRSAWFAFWTRLAQEAGTPMDVSFLLDRALAYGDQRSLHVDGWWQFWQGLIDLAMRDDPRLVTLLAVMRQRRQLTTLGGVSWLANSEVSPEHTDLLTPQAPAMLRAMWLAHLRMLERAGRLRKPVLKVFDLEALAAAVVPERDLAIDWRGLDALDMAQARWKVEPNAFVALKLPTPGEGARELPQWAFMRLAMEAAHQEADPQAWAVRFYDALSKREVVLLDALREAGKPHASFLEDHTIRVGDNFQSILAATHKAGLATEWTGTIAMDWRHVRAKGAPISGGQRTSKGVMAFWDAVDSILQAQGRQGDDRPVTMALPLWHREVMELLTLRDERAPRLQPVVLVPDLFFERLRQRRSWTFLDPHVFPEAQDGTEAGYLKAEAAMATRRKAHPHAVQQMPADQVWKQLLAATHAGSPFLVFEGSLQAAAPFPQSAPSIMGLDGVGALPLPLRGEHLTANRWASGAVNLALALDAEGQPAPDRIQAAIGVALRLLDNLTMLAEAGQPTPYRSVCLGPIGYYEAIDLASAHMNHDADLLSEWVVRMAQVWHSLVQQANRDLASERGRAAGWSQPDAQPMGPGPFRDRLRDARKGQMPGISLSDDAQAVLASSAADGPADRFGGRFTVCSVWAPFENAARLAGTTPGGIGTLYPVERVFELDGRSRLVPTPFLLHHLRQQPGRLERYATVLQYPDAPDKWPRVLGELSHPDRLAWERRLQHAALIRPWVEQGVSLTLPVGLPEDLLHQLLARAWWLGLNSVRFAPVLKDAAGMDKPDKPH